MPPAPPNYDYSGVIPTEMAAQIIQEAAQYSTVLQLANLVPMGTQINELPIPKTLPSANWVAAPGGRKPFTELALQTQVLRAEEVAAVTAIPEQYLEDTAVNLWGWVRPRLAEAIAVAIDRAIIFGVGAPGSFPPGGIVAPANTFSTPVAAGYDAVDMVNMGMGAVEGRGLAVNGHAADLVVKSILRGQRDLNGSLLMGETQVDQGARPTIYGVPVAYNPFAVTTGANFLTGAWQYLMVGIRQDIRYTMDPNAVIADAQGAVVISGFQDNVVPLKVWGRFACAIVRPVTTRVPGGAVPFARATLPAWTPPPPAEDAAEARTAKK